MQTLTCPIPSDINPLQSNGFMFDIIKLPEIRFFCQDVQIPSLDLPCADFHTPLVTIPLPGDKPTFGDLNITFMIDSTMLNFIALHNWMIGLGFPESHLQYKNFLASRTNSLSPVRLLAEASDATLQILSASNNEIQTIRFENVLPTNLQGLQLMSTTTSTVYLTAQATFKYTLYKFD